MFDANQLNIAVGIFVFLLGASIGSFLNVVAYRVPLGISLVRPGSSCPSCKAPIGPLGLVPVFGYFFLRGRCASCHVKISPTYPLVEALTGAATVLLFFHYLSGAELVLALSGNEYAPQGGMLDSSLSNAHLLGKLHFEKYVPFFAALWLLYTGIPLSLIDFRYRILPDVIVLPGTLVAFALGAFNPEVGWLTSLVGLAAGSLGLLLVAKVYEFLRGREGLGLGDVKYLALLGATVGWQGVIWTVALGSILGAVFGLLTGMVRREGLSAAIPFGPFLFLGALIVQVWSRELQSFFYGF